MTSPSERVTDELEGILRCMIETVKSIADEMPPPNDSTPRFIAAAATAESFLNRALAARPLDPAIKPAAVEGEVASLIERLRNASSVMPGHWLLQSTGERTSPDDTRLTYGDIQQAAAALASIREADAGRLRLALEAIVEETGHLHLLSHAQARAALDTQGVW